MNTKIVAVFIFITVAFNLNGNNDLTKVGIVDVNEIYTRFIKDSADARKFDEYKSSIEDEISERKIEIDNIDKDLIDARDNDDEDLIAELESDLQIAKINLQDYVKFKNRELSAKIASDATKENFSTQMYDAVQEVALENGYSVILQKDNANMLWHATDVDITELVIQKIMN